MKLKNVTVIDLAIDAQLPTYTFLRYFCPWAKKIENLFLHVDVRMFIYSY